MFKKAKYMFKVFHTRGMAVLEMRRGGHEEKVSGWMNGLPTECMEAYYWKTVTRMLVCNSVRICWHHISPFKRRRPFLCEQCGRNY